MYADKLQNKLSTIYSEEDANRTHFQQDGDKQWIVTDMHGLTGLQARQYLHNLMALTFGQYDVFVVHGYHGGQVIRDMLWQHAPVSNYVVGIEQAGTNKGATILRVA